MRNKFLLLLIAAMALFSCKKDYSGQPDPPVVVVPPDPVPERLLKEITIPNLPSPFYHFEYNSAGKPILASYASGLFVYAFEYDGNRINQLKNLAGDMDRLLYDYDDDGRVTTIFDVDQANNIVGRYEFEYKDGKLITMKRFRRVTTSNVLARTLKFSYWPDGNLSDLLTKYESVPVAGQTESTSNYHFDLYDNKKNIDGFSLLHPEFFEPWMILPGVQLQKNNPGRETLSGDGAGYRVDYTYTYDNNNFPLSKSGAGVFLSGPDIGRTFTTNSTYTYYP